MTFSSSEPAMLYVDMKSREKSMTTACVNEEWTLVEDEIEDRMAVAESVSVLTILSTFFPSQEELVHGAQSAAAGAYDITRSVVLQNVHNFCRWRRLVWRPAIERGLRPARVRRRHVHEGSARSRLSSLYSSLG